MQPDTVACPLLSRPHLWLQLQITRLLVTYRVDVSTTKRRAGVEVRRDTNVERRELHDKTATAVQDRSYTLQVCSSPHSARLAGAVKPRHVRRGTTGI